MPRIVEFLSFGVGTGNEVRAQSDYASAMYLQKGFIGGILLHEDLNKVLRQATVPGAALMRAVSDILDVDIVDDGDVAAVVAKIKAAFSLPGVTTLIDAPTINVDASVRSTFRVRLGGNRVLANPTGLKNGQVLNFRISQDDMGTRGLTYGTKYKFPGGIVPVLTATPNASDFMSSQYDSADDILFCVMSKGFA